jgi:DNA modification methylase
LKTLPSESVDLIYIDPPFFSNRNYEVIWGDEGEVRSFKDRWSGGMDHYIGWLKERVEELYRVLKPTGSFYLHCDWHADAYIRVQILDKIFGAGNFINHIVWSYKTGGVSNKWFAKKHDTIYLYVKNLKKMTINIPLEKKYIPTLKGRKFAIEELGAKTNNEPCNLCGEVGGFYHLGGMSDVWSDIGALFRNNKERIGYPTQKPEALLERIIKASSNEGDVVLDAFCGGGTTISVADKLNRRWIGIDQSVQAIKVSEGRLNDPSRERLFQAPFSVKLHKYDYDTLRYSDAFEFETFIVEQFGGAANAKQRGDFGLDGKKDGIALQVKRSDDVGRNIVDNFKSAISRMYGKQLNDFTKSKTIAGYIIAFSFGKGAVEEVARLKNEENLIIKLVKVEDIIPIATKPNLEITFVDKGIDAKNNRLIEFIATSKTPFEFFMWDFNYNQKEGFNPKIMLEIKGVVEQSFSSGEHIIACKIIDKEGLENIETLKLKVNGVVKKV